MMSRFRPIDRDTAFLLPPSVQEWLPEGHLARYVVDVVEGLDLSELERAYAGKGSVAYHPAMLLSLLIYGYATGTFSSRKIERASLTIPWRSVTSPASCTPIMTPWPASVSALARTSNQPSCRCSK
jgi:transposase